MQEDSAILDSGTVSMYAKGVVHFITEHDGRVILQQRVSRVDPFSLL